MKNILVKVKRSGNPGVFLLFILTVSAVFSLMYNLQLFRNSYPPQYLTLLVIISIAQNMIIWYIAGLNKWAFLIFAPLMFGAGGGFDYFIRTLDFGIGIGSFEVIFQTNIQEAAGVINRSFIWRILLGVAIGLFFAAVRFYIGGIKGWKMKTAVLFLLLITVFAGKLPEKSLKEVKYGKGAATERGFHAMPEKLLENLYHYWLNVFRMKKLLRDRAALPLPEVSYGGKEEFVAVFILTDALRPDHMQINGYPRPTTPNIVKEGFLSFADMYACETSTSRSVACLTTRASRNDPRDKYITEPSLLKIFKAAGFDTAWISAQGSISGADQGPAVISSDADYVYFDSDTNTFSKDIYDSNLLPEMDKFMARKNPKKFILLHLNGSHWDYHKRYSPEQRKFTPECVKWVFDCNLEETINSYDNTIVATDEFFKAAATRLKDKNAVIWFSSDHGQFLGEYGFRLHSYEMLQYKPVAVVPFGLWLSPSMKNDPSFQAVENNKEKITSHDSIFHSLTDCAGIASPLIEKDLSVCSEKLIDLPDEFPNGTLKRP